MQIYEALFNEWKGICYGLFPRVQLFVILIIKQESNLNYQTLFKLDTESCVTKELLN